MKDIARDLGVSTVTVSKVLRNHPDVGQETRDRVLARVKELDYRPNLAARGLVTGRTYLVGLTASLFTSSLLCGNRRISFRDPSQGRLLPGCLVL